MQLARRLPSPASLAVGSMLSRVPGASTGAAAAWLMGKETTAKELILSAEAQRPSRLLGEIALNIGMLDSASRIANLLDSGQSLRSRILWTTGHIDEAIDALPGNRRASRLAAERELLSPGWWPTPDKHIVARPTGTSKTVSIQTSSLHVLTNSLPHTRSGYAYRSHLVLRTLRDAGHPVIAATRPSYPVTIGRLSLKQVETVDGIDYLRHIPTVPGTTPTSRLSEQASWISAQAKKHGAEVLHTTTHYVNGLATGAAARAINLPWVYEVRGVLEETWASAGANKVERQARRDSQRFSLMRAKEIEVANSADAVVTLGETMRNYLVLNGVEPDSITVIPNSVSDAVINANTRCAAADMRARLGLPRNGIWVGTAASIVGYEGLDDLIDAVTIARTQGSDLRLLIVGDGVAMPELRERAKALGENAKFVGRQPQAEAINFQLGLDVIVIPRKDRPVCRLVTPIKPIEAMGLARPVVYSDLPALRELVPASAGIPTSAEDPESLALELAKLGNDKHSRLTMGEEGRKYVLRERQWKDIGVRYDELYKTLAGAQRQ
ncbi:glycosyl transferase family 1 [Brevibacterium aurantiacum]|nr:glycosyl transferase family 1 [Brevibacterium aurantiacum]